MGWKIFWAVTSLLSNVVKTYWHCTWGRHKGGKSWLRGDTGAMTQRDAWHSLVSIWEFLTWQLWGSFSRVWFFFVLQQCFIIWGQTLYKYSYHLLLAISFYFLMDRLSYRWATERLSNWFKIILLGRPGAFYRPWQLELTTNFFRPCVSLLW